MRVLINNLEESNRLSAKANMILLVIFIEVDNCNEFNSNTLLAGRRLVICKRTINKYLLELESKGVIMCVSKNKWRLSSEYIRRDRI